VLPALQTIARGIGFRFEDVKTLLYNEVGAHCGWVLVPALVRGNLPSGCWDLLCGRLCRI
jgi:hypothetical protein